MKGILIGLVVVVLAVGLAIASMYNGIVTKHETITAKWAQVENQLQRRNDLIPNLVNSVKGYAAHEKTVFEDVTKARSQWAGATGMDGWAMTRILCCPMFPGTNWPGLWPRLVKMCTAGSQGIA